MRTLFVKIFLWFWLAMIMVAGTAVVSLHAYLAGEMEGTSVRTVGFQNPVARMAVAILENDGPAALAHYLDRWNDVSGMCQYVLDEQGRALAGQTLPPEVAELSRRLPEPGTEVWRHSPHSTYVASRISCAGGNNYVLVSSMPPRPPGLGGPGMPPGPLRFLWEKPQFLVIILVAVILTSGVVCYALARHLTNPLRELRVSARQIAEGDLAVRVGTGVQNRHDEMGELGRDFNFMAERIESLVSAQRRLLRDMSHELRSPLARLHVALGLARQQTAPQAGAALDRIEREAERLGELIGALLTLVRLEGGQVVSGKTTVDLAALVRSIAADADFEAKSSGRRVRVLRCDECPMIGVPELLHSAIENVVRNSIRYTPENTEVDMTLTVGSGEGELPVVVCVRDQGPGVPLDAIPDIFRPFYRVDDVRNRRTGGAGLGLAIAQQAVRVHGGIISAANVQDGGFMVELRFPLMLGSS
ncbi:MAG: HAMP domain-containing protein [Phycisphaerales bacterium]|nr:HAMP domain-containing protein [Phycisphaerales bacterium]